MDFLQTKLENIHAMQHNTINPNTIFIDHRPGVRVCLYSINSLSLLFCKVNYPPDIMKMPLDEIIKASYMNNMSTSELDDRLLEYNDKFIKSLPISKKIPFEGDYYGSYSRQYALRVIDECDKKTIRSLLRNPRWRQFLRIGFMRIICDHGKMNTLHRKEIVAMILEDGTWTRIIRLLVQKIREGYVEHYHNFGHLVTEKLVKKSFSRYCFRVIDAKIVKLSIEDNYLPIINNFHVRHNLKHADNADIELYCEMALLANKAYNLKKALVPMYIKHPASVTVLKAFTKYVIKAPPTKIVTYTRQISKKDVSDISYFFRTFGVDINSVISFKNVA